MSQQASVLLKQVKQLLNYKSMNKKFFAFAVCALCAISSFAQGNKERELELLSPGGGAHGNWVAEDRSGKMTAEVVGSSMEIVAPDGLTLWYDQKLTGDYQISYRVKMFMQGGENDRLSDLNCFWAASDPLYPNDIYHRSKWRNGLFTNYNTLNLFYVGYGGNHNSTTRFREYHAKYVSAAGDDQLRPVIKEYTDADNLLKPNRWLLVVITVKDGVTTYSADGEELFSEPIAEGRGDGYFGLRLLKNHTIFTDFSIKTL